MNCQREYPSSLKEWQKFSEEVYGEKNKRDYTLKDLVLRLCEEVGCISEALRKDSDQEIVKAIPRFFVWLLAFSVMYPTDIEGTVWDKYNGCCPYCGASVNCFCLSVEAKPDRWYKSDKDMPKSLSDWQKMFSDIYGRINNILPKVSVGLHLAEEVGELSMAFRLRQREGETNLFNEMADVMAWLFSLCSRVGVDLAKETWKKYPGICDTCISPKCECLLV